MWDSQGSHQRSSGPTSKSAPLAAEEGDCRVGVPPASAAQTALPCRSHHFGSRIRCGVGGRRVSFINSLQSEGHLVFLTSQRVRVEDGSQLLVLELLLIDGVQTVFCFCIAFALNGLNNLWFWMLFWFFFVPASKKQIERSFREQ